MIKRDAASLKESPFVPPPARDGRRAHKRLSRWRGGNLWLHFTLLAMAVIFLFPFVWMIGMSLKTDEEATSDALFPSIPTFRAESPYVRAALPVPPPAEVDETRWKTLLPRIAAAVQQLIDAAPLPSAVDSKDIDALRDSAANALMAKLVARQDNAVWLGSDEQIVSALVASVDPDEQAAALDDRLASLELLSLQVKSLDGHVQNVAQGSEIARKWVVESGPGELLPSGEDATVLKYRFASGGDAPVVLRADFDSPVTADQLHRLIVSLKCDDSWHRVDADFQLGSRHWQNDLSYYIVQFRTGSVLLQPPGPIETPYTPRTWISLSEVKNTEPAAATVAPTKATLRLIIRPSSVARAIIGKVQRNYVRAFRSVPFMKYVGNSAVLVIMQVVGALFSASFVAYAFARLNWPGRSLAFGLLLCTMMLPAQVTMIPSFLIWKSLGLYNTLTPLWLGEWMGNAFFIFLMTQQMKTIPKELNEAAHIDGFNAFQTWCYIILPQVKPTLAAIAIMTFMGA
jgi:ABC-type glycerol-3-phosphate transport system permease component